MTNDHSIYREIRPPQALSGRLVCLWSQRVKTDGASLQQRVLPDGCVDIVWIGNSPPLIAGPATRHIVVELPADVEVLGLRLRPGQAGAFLGLPADRLRDANVSLADLWGSAAERLGQVAQDDSPVAEKLGRLADALLKRTADTEVGDPVVGDCITWLARHPGGSIDHLADVADLGLRQLRRRFRTAVGYGPKTFQRIVRLQRLLDLSDRQGAERAGLVALSDAAGYADQAHMSREVRDLTGQVPSVLLAGRGSTLAMSDLFKTDDGETV